MTDDELLAWYKEYQYAEEYRKICRKGSIQAAIGMVSGIIAAFFATWLAIKGGF